MGFSENQQQQQLHPMADSDKWVISALRNSPLKPVFTKPVEKTECEEECLSTTPTYVGSRIPSALSCPPPPKKRKSAPASAKSCHFRREFFNPPDLETIFIRRVQGA